VGTRWEGTSTGASDVTIGSDERFSEDAAGCDNSKPPAEEDVTALNRRLLKRVANGLTVLGTVLLPVQAVVDELPVPWVVSFVLIGMGAVTRVAVFLVERALARRRAATKLASLVRRWPPPPLDAVDPYEDLGVFKSGTAQRAKVGGQFETEDRPPYIPRDIDEEELPRALDDDELREKPFVLLVGASRSGKSRSLFEAACEHFSRNRVVIPRSGEALRELFQWEEPLPDLGPEPVILWLDDLERFLDAGAMDSALLHRWASERPRFVALATIRRTEYNRLYETEGDVGRNARDVLGQARELRLPDDLGDHERKRAQELYPELSFKGGIADTFSDADELIRRLNDGDKAGQEILRAAVDWRRCGLSRPIPDSDLKQVSRRYLPQMTDGDYDRFLEWAQKPLPSLARLLKREEVDGEGFTVSDSIIDYCNGQPAGVEERFRAVGQEAWDYVLTRVSTEEAFSVAFSAYTRGEVQVAEKGFHVASRSPYPNVTAKSRIYIGALLAEQGRLQDASNVYDEVVRRFGDDPTPIVREKVAGAMYNKAFVFRPLDRRVEEVEAYDAVVRRFGDDATPGIREIVASSLINKGLALGELEPHAEKVEAFDEVIRRFGDDDTPAVRELVAKSLLNKALVFRRFDRPIEEVKAYDEVIRRFGDDATSDLRKGVASALYKKGWAFHRLDRRMEELAAYEEVIRRFGDDPASGIREEVARSLLNKGLVLAALGRHTEALDAWDETDRRFGDDPTAGLQESVAKALVNRGNVLGDLDRPIDQLEAYEEVTRRFGDNPVSGLREPVAMSLSNRGIALGDMGRPQEALEAYDEVIRSFGRDPTPSVQRQVAKSLVKKGGALGSQGQSIEAMEVFDQVILRFGEDPAPEVQEWVARSLFNKGVVLRRLGRPTEAKAANDEVIRRFAEDANPDVREVVAMAYQRRAG
jgi:tetratricopeptide (TPR) repeat protein